MCVRPCTRLNSTSHEGGAPFPPPSVVDFKLPEALAWGRSVEFSVNGVIEARAVTDNAPAAITAKSLFLMVPISISSLPKPGKQPSLCTPNIVRHGFFGHPRCCGESRGGIIGFSVFDFSLQNSGKGLQFQRKLAIAPLFFVEPSVEFLSGGRKSRPSKERRRK